MAVSSLVIALLSVTWIFAHSQAVPAGRQNPRADRAASMLPAGGFSAAETLDAAALREAFEAAGAAELGMRIEDDSPLTDAAQPADWTPPADAGGTRGTCGDCQFGDRVEGEPICANGYVDAFNGGCNFTPNVFGEIRCGQTVCGTYGTFQTSGGQNFRDTDWYHFTLTQAADVTWTAVGEARTRVFILQGTCPAASLGTAAADACQPATVTLTNLAPGTYSAFMSTDAFTGVPCGSRYRATLSVAGCCSLPCQPPSQLLEGEPECATAYVDAYNGGCNSTPSVFGNTACNLTICGTYGTFQTAGGQNFRDTDWYHFTLLQPSNVTWSATGEARTRVFLLQGTCPASSLGTAAADPCTPATVSATLPAGTYAAFVATDSFSGIPCGTRYQARLSVEGCGCTGDLDGDGIVGINDLALLLSRFGTFCP